MHTRTTYLLLLALLAHLSGMSQWVNIPLPSIDAPIAASSVAVHGDTLLIGTYRSSIYRSTDNGMTWSESGSGLSASVNQTPALLIAKDMVFAGTNEGVYRSTDWGEHWTLQGGVLSYVGSLALSDTTLYAVSTDGVFRSRDWGVSWQADNAGLPTVGGGAVIPVGAIAADGTLLLLACRDGVYRRSNSDTVWAQANNGIPTDGLYHASGRSITSHDGRAYFGTGYCGGSVYSSSDGGNTWSPISNGLPTGSGTCYQDVYALSFRDSLLLSGLAYGVYRSSNGGTTWQSFNAGLPLGPASDLFVPSITSTATEFFAATFAGVYRCPSGDSVWRPVIVQIPRPARVQALGGSGGSLFAQAWTDYFNGIITRSYHSTDEGDTWRIDTSAALERTSHFFNLGKSFYAGGRGLFVSSDNGFQWTEVDSGLFEVDALVSNDTTMFAGYGTYFLNDDMGGVFRSTNSGLRWDSVGLQGIPVRSLAMEGMTVVAQSKGVYAPFALHRTTDNGATWSQIDSLLPHGIEITSLAVVQGILYASTNHGVLASDNMGTSWREASTGLPKDSTGGLLPASLLYHNSTVAEIERTLFCLIGPRLFMSENGGAAWQAVDQGLSTGGQALVAVSANDANLIVSTGLDLWRRSLSELVSTVSSVRWSPVRFSLEQNFPNPFNPSTTIQFGLSERSHVRLTVYTMLGQEVARLVDEAYEPGLHTIVFNGGTLATGVYFYRLDAGGKSVSRRMLLLK